jgi:hypothetical protein
MRAGGERTAEYAVNCDSEDDDSKYTVPSITPDYSGYDISISVILF